MRLLFSPRTLLGVGIGFGLAHFLDPDRGAGRRAQAKDQLAARARRAGRDVARQGRYAAGEVRGKLHEASDTAPTPLDGKALADRVASEVLRDVRWKGSVNIDAAGTTVVLRGEVRLADDIDELEQRVRRVPGVTDVESYLHLPGQPAPNVARSLRATADIGG